MLLTREDRLPYDKPNLSKDYLAGSSPSEWIPMRGEEEYAAARIDLRLGVTVERIDPERSLVHLAGGETVAFDRLILPLARCAVWTSRSIPRRAFTICALGTDADALRAGAEGARKAVVIGTGFIGLEAAVSLRQRGLDVTVIGRDEQPLALILGHQLGDSVRRIHEEHGVRFRLGRTPVEIRADGVLLDDGSSEAADLVVAGIGVEPDVALAERAGLAVSRGIVVDEMLRTSAPNIYAAGDAARFPYARTGASIRVEHWVVAGRQGQAAARNALGRPERYAAVPFFWSQHYDLVLRTSATHRVPRRWSCTGRSASTTPRRSSAKAAGSRPW